MKYEVISRHDPARVVAARRCPEVEWGRSTILGNTVERGYNTNIVTLLCPVKQSDAQVREGHCNAALSCQTIRRTGKGGTL